LAEVGPSPPDEPDGYGSGSYDEIEHYPLARVSDASELDAVSWPDPERFDFGMLIPRIREERAIRDRAVMVANGNLFETAWYMRGFEQMLGRNDRQDFPRHHGTRHSFYTTFSLASWRRRQVRSTSCSRRTISATSAAVSCLSSSGRS
jgi:hypothetical protein